LDPPLLKQPPFKEADVSDKRTWVHDEPLLTADRVDYLQGLFRECLRSLQPVDEMVGMLVNILEDTGQPSNTYIALPT
jgi:hypothetical protein